MSTSGDKLVESMGHPQEKTKMGNFVGKITGANKVEHYLDTAYNYLTDQQQQGGGSAAAGGAAGGAAGAGAAGGTASQAGAAQSSNGATTTQQ